MSRGGMSRGTWLSKTVRKRLGIAPVPAATYHRAKRSTLLGLVLCSVLGACGVPAQPNAQRIPADRISLAVQKPERLVTSFLLVGGSKLYGRPDCIPLTLDLKRSAEAELVNLGKPLSPADAVDFGSSVNTYDLSVASFDEDTGTVTIDVTNAPGFKQDYLAIGQVVLSLTSIKGVERVGMMQRERPEADKPGIELVLGSVKLADSIDAPGIKQGELLLPASGESFVDSVSSALVPIYFFENTADGVRLRLTGKYVTDFDPTDAPKIQAAQYLGQLDLGPTGESASEKLARKKFSDLAAQVEQTDENGPLKLTVSAAYDLLSPQDQALALGQLLLTLELIPSFPELPPVEFYVNLEPKNVSDDAPEPSVPAETSVLSERRTKVPNAKGEEVEREFLLPSDYEDLKADNPIPGSSKEISSSRECR
jgi:hypothetical protein